MPAVFAIYTGWLRKTSPTFCFRKDTCSKPRQNFFGSWIEHCLHYSYLPRQWCHSRRHWEILHEVDTRDFWILTTVCSCKTVLRCCSETQTMSHTVESCPLTKLNGGLSRLHSADEDAFSWLTSYGSWHAYEKKKCSVNLLVILHVLDTQRGCRMQVG